MEKVIGYLTGFFGGMASIMMAVPGFTTAH